MRFAECLDITEQEVSDILQTAAQHVSLDEPLNQEEGNSLLAVLENERDAAPDDFLMQESLQQEIHRVLATLKTREAETIRLSFGLVGERALSLEEIAEHFGLPRERTRQIKDNALRRLRQRTRSERLKKYLV
jgi:RNA polymerase primary sigma factor